MTGLTPVPYTFVNGTTADANQVDTNFSSIVNQVNALLPWAIANGGTGLSAITPPVVRIFTTTGTYTPTTGMTFCLVIITAPGSGGSDGGAGGTGGGGGGGETAIGVFSAAQVGASLTVLVPAGGIGGVGGTPNGTPAATGSAFGGLLTAAQGQAPGAFGFNNGGSGGSGTGTTMHIKGGSGGFTVPNGGSSFWGSGGQYGAAGAVAQSGVTYGTGGAGNPSAQLGGDGAPGVCLIIEFFGPT